MQEKVNVAIIGQAPPTKPVFDGNMRNGRMPPWVKNLGFAILRIIRVIMLPIWVIILVFDYLIILMLLLFPGFSPFRSVVVATRSIS